MTVVFSCFPLYYSVSVTSSVAKQLNVIWRCSLPCMAFEHCSTFVTLPLMEVVLGLRGRRTGIEMLSVIALCNHKDVS